MAEQSEVLSPRSPNRSINKLFNKLISRSFASKHRNKLKESYVDSSIVKQKKFLETKLEKLFPSYQVSPRQVRKKSNVRTPKLPQVEIEKLNIKNVFKFKCNDMLQNSKKNYSAVGRLRFRPKTQSLSESFNLISLLRETAREPKSQTTPKLELKLTKLTS